MKVIYNPKPLTELENQAARKEGWQITVSDKKHPENDYDKNYSLTPTEEPNAFTSPEEAWCHIITQANKADSLHEKAANLIRFFNPEQCDELNMTFVPKLGKESIPTHCTRCKSAVKPKDINLVGRMPDFSTRSGWFTDKENDLWSIRIELKTPWYHLDDVDYKKDHATFKVMDSHCKECSDIMSEMFKDLF